MKEEHEARAGGLAGEILAQARECGADLAGLARVADVRRSPSHVIAPRLDTYQGVGAKPSSGRQPGEVLWPERARSVLVIALAHPETRPELDWWGPRQAGGTPGNHLLMGINERLSGWLGQVKGLWNQPLAYHVEQGGIFLKDAAVLAGLGCIGRNNLLLSPAFGPRVRLRALLLEADLEPSGPPDFDPCQSCPAPCLRVCPQDAFAACLYDPADFPLSDLPGRSGSYDRHACNDQMEQDMEAGARQSPPAGSVHYCRRCEWACPVGKET